MESSVLIQSLLATGTWRFDLHMSLVWKWTSLYIPPIHRKISPIFFLKVKLRI